MINNNATLTRWQKNNMKKNISIALLALFAIGAGVANAQVDEPVLGPPAVTTTSAITLRACPQDEKFCPTTGTGVGRSGPNCEFVCPPAGATGGSIKPRILPPNIRPEVREIRKDIRDESKDMRASTNAAIKEMRGEIKNDREAMEKRAMELRASTTMLRANMKDEAMKKRLEVAHKQADLVNNRLQAAIERVQKLSDRVGAALDKFAAQGVDVTVSRGHLADAKIKLDEARTKAAAVKLAIETAFSNITASSTPKDSMKNAQELVKDTVKAIQDAHGKVAEAISSIKPGQNKPRPATTTAAIVPTSTSTSATGTTTAQ